MPEQLVKVKLRCNSTDQTPRPSHVNLPPTPCVPISNESDAPAMPREAELQPPLGTCHETMSSSIVCSCCMSIQDCSSWHTYHMLITILETATPSTTGHSLAILVYETACPFASCDLASEACLLPSFPCLPTIPILKPFRTPLCSPTPTQQQRPPNPACNQSRNGCMMQPAL